MSVKPIPGAEYRYLTTPVELRDAGDGVRRLTGHAAVVEVDQPIGPPDDPYWIERIRRGAFADVLNDPETAALFNHNPDIIVGRLGAGTLLLSEDERGLFSEIFPPDTQGGRDMIISVQRRDVSQMSFGFYVARGLSTWKELPDGKVHRTIEKFTKLYDVSPVTFAAFKATDVAVREARAAGEVLRDLASTEMRIGKDSLDLLYKRLAVAAL